MGVLKRSHKAAAQAMVVIGAALLGSGTAGKVPDLLGMEPVRIDLSAPNGLCAGSRFEVDARVTLAGGEGQPFLLTARTEGTAVEVVRGRFLRADAVAAEESSLTFRIPLVAAGPGDGLLRIFVRSFRCQTRCSAVVGEATLPLRVESEGPPVN